MYCTGAIDCVWGHGIGAAGLAGCWLLAYIYFQLRAAVAPVSRMRDDVGELAGTGSNDAPVTANDSTPPLHPTLHSAIDRATRRTWLRRVALRALRETWLHVNCRTTLCLRILHDVWLTTHPSIRHHYLYQTAPQLSQPSQCLWRTPLGMARGPPSSHAALGPACQAYVSTCCHMVAAFNGFNRFPNRVML
jgi:hypothetical protein